MSFIEILGAVFSLNLTFLVDIIMNNLFWVFGFLCAGYFFSNGKSTVATAVIFSAILLSTQDISDFIGFAIYTSYFLMILYLGRVVVFLFLENTKGGAKLIPLFYVLVFYASLIIVAFGVE